MSNTILIKRSGTADSAPDAGNLALGELAINYNDGNLFYKNASNQVTVIASNKFLSVSGNVTGANVFTGGLISAASTITSGSNITGANILTGGLISAGSNITGSNILTGGLISAAGNITAGAGNFFIGNGSQLTGVVATGIGTLTSLSVTGNIDTGNLFTNGVVSAQGNVTGGNIFTGGLISAVGNLTAGNISTSGSSGNISGANVITGTTLSAIGNAIAGNIFTGGLISAAGNITAGAGNFFIGNGSQLTGVVATGIGTLTSLSVTGNIDTGNLQTSGVITATGNVISGNVFTVGIVSAGGNIITANLNASNLSSTGGLTIATGSNGNINLQPNGTGNIVLNNTYINGVQLPVQDQDAASKIYVDNLVTTAISYHQAVLVATNSNLAVATGGTITYNQPNGAGNGVGATLTTTGTYNLIDTASVQTVGTRILVKNEANATHNGIYEYSSTTVIVRAANEDTYGAASPTALSINDYFFVQSGNVNKGSAWIVDQPSGTITFGTSSIGFAQFSNTQVYTANTNAGLVLVGTEFSAKVDNTTTAFDGGGNIVVKTSANLTTPNIGAATGTSLSLTGNVTAGNVSTSGNVVGANVYSGGLLSAAGNIQGNNVSTTNDVLALGLISAQGNITGANIFTNGAVSAVGNITGGNISGGNGITAGFDGVSTAGNVTAANVFTGGQVSAVGNITGNNISGGNGITAGLLGVSTAGNVTAANVFTGGQVSAAANVTGGNLITSGLASVNSLTVVTSASASGNVTGGNIITPGLISAQSNVTGANLFTNGIISAQGNITGDYFIGNGSQLTGVTATSAGFPVSNGTSNINATSSGPITVGVGGTSNIAVFATTGVEITGLMSASGNLLTGGQITSTRAGSAATNGGQIFLNGLTNNRIDWNTEGTGAPAYTTRSVGAKVVLYPSISGSATDYALGVEAGALWSGIPGNDGGQFFKWYGGNVPVASLSGTGVFSATGNITAGASSFFIGNGSQLTGIDATSIQDGTSNVRVVSSGGNVTVNVGGTSNIAVFSTTGVEITGLISASGNITGANIFTGGLISAGGNINAANIAGSNLFTGGMVSALGNITTPNIVSAGGNVVGSNFLTTGIISAQGNVTGGNIETAGLISATSAITSLSNITGANIFTGGLISAQGNITGANIVTGGNVFATGLVSATANITGGNIVTGGNVFATGLVSATANVTGGNIVTGGNVFATGLVSATANITGGNILTAGTANAATLIVTSLANITATTAATNTTSGALLVAGGVGVVGNVYAGGMYVSGNAVLTTTSTVDGGTF